MNTHPRTLRDLRSTLSAAMGNRLQLVDAPEWLMPLEQELGPYWGDTRGVTVAGKPYLSVSPWDSSGLSWKIPLLAIMPGKGLLPIDYYVGVARQEISLLEIIEGLIREAAHTARLARDYQSVLQGYIEETGLPIASASDYERAQESVRQSVKVLNMLRDMLWGEDELFRLDKLIQSLEEAA